jgi:hypothetical protein
MKAMLEARMVAARIQRPLVFEHGAIAARDRITFSSQGSRKRAHMFAAYHRQKNRSQKSEVRGVCNSVSFAAVEMSGCVLPNPGDTGRLLDYSVYFTARKIVR